MLGEQGGAREELRTTKTEKGSLRKILSLLMPHWIIITMMTHTQTAASYTYTHTHTDANAHTHAHKHYMPQLQRDLHTADGSYGNCGLQASTQHTCILWKNKQRVKKNKTKT